MNKYAKLLVIALLVSSMSPIFAVCDGDETTKNTSSAEGEGCGKTVKKGAKLVAYKFPTLADENGNSQYTWEGATDCKGKAKFFGKWTLRVAPRLAIVAAAATGVALAVKQLTAKENSNDQLANEVQEEATTTEEVA